MPMRVTTEVMVRLRRGHAGVMVRSGSFLSAHCSSHSFLEMSVLYFNTNAFASLECIRSRLWHGDTGGVCVCGGGGGGAGGG